MSVSDVSPEPPANAFMPQDRDVAAMDLRPNALGHDEGTDRIGSRARAHHAGGSGHRRVVVLVAESLTTGPGGGRLSSAPFTSHENDPSAHRWKCDWRPEEPPI